MLEKTYGRLTIVKELANPTKGMKRVVVRCKCGKEKEVSLYDVLNGKTQSCGCLRNERVSASVKTHGLSNTPEYRAWWDMVARCTNVDHPSYSRYGGRGITIHPDWISSPVAFIEYVGKKPTKRSMLDRINNDSGYFPGNVRWTDSKTSGRNTSIVKVWVVNGVAYQSAYHAAETIGVDHCTVKAWCDGYLSKDKTKFHPPLPNCYSFPLYKDDENE